MPMIAPYRQQEGVWLIDLQLDRLQQLANSMDPAPFPRRDLDPDAERYIVDAVRELPFKEPVGLVLWLPPQEVAAVNPEKVRQTIHHYFQWEYESARRKLSHHLADARRATALGLSFMVVCMVIRNLLAPLDALLAHAAAEGLLVIGWVALWRPVEMFLYDWWPLRRTMAVMQKLAGIDVQLWEIQHASHE